MVSSLFYSILHSLKTFHSCCTSKSHNLDHMISLCLVAQYLLLLMCYVNLRMPAETHKHTVKAPLSSTLEQPTWL